MEKITYELGDIVRLKKKHPCGSFEWEILRTGMDFRLKCQGCGHLILIPRTKFEKMVKGKVNQPKNS
ncbi:hypothetical protein SELR_26220 [Selenomonas ruminantium subsp. lactilytica TAM6421]|uniref:DUF951 domain-containing protein n=1 Tax=Selenomonas ruminantium subsp. lactilytica (strain NBRC 103574 / TAM6421) TaxID=927704 RepID=I0GU93_SELRL|nr:DUF951 domain-containing protein [Selenomonas ruminantium]BAL84330.1 hypothetical protein SELR_26220 [Selenomonas ruminantium subsp. lactilytica TAM6421]